ncbi:hypothetical protein GQ53DRAFT_747777 [Thozetella sp. PMI_491]|nr:hypothetical protein GQ53DRAFT_747777 [Thozetella sp. PMI_491]
MAHELDPKILRHLMVNRTLRCLLKTKYTPESRHSSVAIAFAESQATMATEALVKHIPNAEPGSIRVLANMVKIMRGDRIFVCYDVFLPEFTGAYDDIINAEQPVHMVKFNSDGTYHLHRDVQMDKMVMLEYTRLKKVDKGSLPYFVDTKNPPFYDEGERVESPA